MREEGCLMAGRRNVSHASSDGDVPTWIGYVGGILAIIVALITILQIAGITRVKCLWSSCDSATATPTSTTIPSTDLTATAFARGTPLQRRIYPTIQ